MRLEESEVLKRLLDMKLSGEAKKFRVLDVKNDPFWPSPARIRDAKWVAEVWREKVGKKTYDRGFHYKLVSLNVECPWGKHRRVYPISAYINVDSDFSKLVAAIRDARSWGLLPWDAIEDRKHVGLEKWVNYGWQEGNREVKPFENFDGDISHEPGVDIPEVYEIDEACFVEDDFDEITETIIDDVLEKNMTSLTPSRYQPYYVAVVSEKSGLRSIARDVLSRLSHGFDFLNFEGQASATLIRDFLHNRILKDTPPEQPISKKKIRIFYLSDYDYSGRVMPPAFIQKLFFYIWHLKVNLDIKVKPLALTKDIVEEYDLPPAPVPERKLGAKTLQDRWLRDFGKIVEIDSLIALHPGVLEDIITKEIGKYIDKDLARTVKEKIGEVEDEARDAILEAVEEQKADWLEARASLLKAMNEVNQAIKSLGINEALKELKRKVEDLSRKHDLDELVANYQNSLADIYVDYDPPDLDIKSDFEVDDSEEEWLFDSSRDLTEQAKILRRFKP
jgi:hypothetical protein